jgi:hypothetical protein
MGLRNKSVEVWKSKKFIQMRQRISQLINGAKNRNEARGEKTHHEKGKEYERK